MRPATARPALSELALLLLPFHCCSCLSLVRTTKFDSVSDALHAHGRRLPDHRHHVIRDFARIDVDRAHAREPGAHRIAPALERLDEDRHRRKTVRIHQLPDRPRLTGPMASCVNMNCSTVSPLESSVTAFSSMPLCTSA